MVRRFESSELRKQYVLQQLEKISSEVRYICGEDESFYDVCSEILDMITDVADAAYG